MWTLVKNDFNDIELVRNDSYEGEVERIEMSNNENFVKVNTYLGSKLLHVGKFDWKANDFAGQFKNNLGGRSSFLKKWKELDPASVSDGNLRIDHTKRRFVSENTSKHESNPTPKNNSPATQKKDFKSRKEVPREVEKSMTDTYNSITEDSMHDTTDTKEREEKGFLEELKKRFKGYYRLHVTDLAEPSFCHSVRQPDPKHIKELETEFKENPHNHYTMMVVNIPGATEFPDNLFDGKSVFETIGGNHSRIALQNILKDKDVINKEDFQERMCAVYCNLSPEQSKRIGMDHNAIHKFGKELNYFSRVQCFRNTLFQEAGMVGKVDPLSKATPKDSEIISVWKKQLEAITGAKNRKDMNNKYRQDIRLAQLETKCWVQMTQFVELFEKNKGKTISGRQLRCVDGLTEDQLISILQEYNNDKLDFNQFKSRCQALQGSKIETKRHKISKDQSKTDADKNQEATCGEHNGDSQCITDLSKETEIKRQAKELEKKIEWLEEENSNLQHQLEDSKIQLECKCKEFLECQKELAVCKEESKKKLLQIEDSKRKISKLYEESKRFTINEQKRKASETVTQFAEKLARDVELNPSPKKKLSLERLEVNFEKGEAIEALWKNDNHWYDAVIIEKRKNGYYVQFTMDKIKSVVKECNIRKKHNIDKTNWRTVRLKLPSATGDIGWAVEFRPMEVQITDFENAAYSVFVMVLVKIIVEYKLSFILPISMVDENIDRASKIDAVLNEKFYFRKMIFTDDTPEHVKRHFLLSNNLHQNGDTREFEEKDLNDIVNGFNTYPGLIPLMNYYLHEKCISLASLEPYLTLISERASGKRPTTARFIRDYVMNHPEYKQDSVVTETINYDLLKLLSKRSETKNVPSN